MKETTFLLETEAKYFRFLKNLFLIFLKIFNIFSNYLACAIKNFTTYHDSLNFRKALLVNEEKRATHYLASITKMAQKELNCLFFYFKNYKISPKKLLKSLTLGLIIIFLGYFSVLKIASFYEAKNGVRIVSILTNSMSPTIPPGSLVITQELSSYQKGDVVTYQLVSNQTGFKFSRTITHRIIEERNDEEVFITKGDFNSAPDATLVKKEYILGKVIFTLPFFGYIYSSIKTVPGFIGFIVFPSLLLLQDQIIYLKKESSRYS